MVYSLLPFREIERHRIAITPQRYMCRIRMLKLTTLSLVLTLVSPHPNGRAAGTSATDDIELARRAAGNLGERSEASGPDAFTELYHRYLPGIYRYHLARTGHVQEAEDINADSIAPGLEAIASGYSLRFPEDVENPEHQFDAYDALYVCG